MRAILIDAFKQATEIVDIPNDPDKSTLDKIYSLLSNTLNEYEVRCFAASAIMRNENNNSQVDIFIDDEGLLKLPLPGFIFEGAPQPYAGNGLIIETDVDSGDRIPLGMDILDVARAVKFIKPSPQEWAKIVQDMG